MLAVFVGLLAEQMAVEGRMEVLERRYLDDYPVTLGSFREKAVLVCRTGLGERRGQGAARAVLGAFATTGVLSARMATGVPDDLRVGELVLCERVNLWRGRSDVVEPPLEADRRLLVVAEQATQGAHLSYVLSSALTAAQMAPRPLNRALVPSGYSVVDTEGHSIGQAANALGVPFVAVRVSMGRSFDRIPESINFVAERGVIRPWRAIFLQLRRPNKIPPFIQLAISMRRAALKLSAFTNEFLREWSLEP